MLLVGFICYNVLFTHKKLKDERNAGNNVILANDEIIDMKEGTRVIEESTELIQQDDEDPTN